MRRKVREKQVETDQDGSKRDEAEEGTNTHAVLWTRRPVCGPRTDVIDRLSALRSAGELAGFDVETCPEEVAVSGQTRHSRVVEAYEQFRAWALDAGVSVSPPFDQRTVTSLVGRTEEVLTVPVMCLAVYDDDLCGVYPCSDGDRTWTVTDYLDAYEAAESPPTLAELRDS